MKNTRKSENLEDKEKHLRNNLPLCVRLYDNIGTTDRLAASATSAVAVHSGVHAGLSQPRETNSTTSIAGAK